MMSNIFKLSVALISFVRQHCFHAFLLYFDFRSEVMWLLFHVVDPHVSTGCTFLIFNTMSVYLFIVSLLFGKLCFTKGAFYSQTSFLVIENWAAAVLFWPFFLYLLHCLPFHH